MNEHQHRRDREQGFSLVELTVALVLFSIGLLAGNLTAATKTARDTAEVEALKYAAKSIREELLAMDFDQIGTAIGRGSNVWITDGEVSFTRVNTATITGRVRAYSSEHGIHPTFEEIAPSFDLNGNGTLDGTVTDYQVLPVLVQLELADSGRSISVPFILSPPTGQ